jgi:hypothetical protein
MRVRVDPGRHMNERNKIIVIVAICASALIAGCKAVPVVRLEPAGPPPVDRVDRASSVCRELIAAGMPLSAKQAQALLPAAEHIMNVSALPTFLAGQPGFDECTATGAMAQIHEDYLAGKEGEQPPTETQSTGDDWRADAAFVRCTIWLYHWRTPSKLMPKGLLLPHEAGLGLSSYFLVQDGMVVRAGYIARREK